MADNSCGHIDISAVVICEGDLSDPRFPTQLELVLKQLNAILGDKVKVRKLEPWNSVRVTLSIPREAALRLRQLADEGSQQLRALGILSVQVEGDQVISLRLASGSVSSEPQEIILRTTQDGSSSNERRESELGMSTFLSPAAVSPTASTNNNSQVQFKSPNVVCPSNSVVPKVGTTATTSSNVSSGSKSHVGPFPFTSMNQAIHSNREAPFNTLPPPYPGKHPPVTISSPLLVNLLQNDGTKEAGSMMKANQATRSTRTPPTVQKPTTTTVSTSSVSSSAAKINNPTLSQANVLVNSSVSPSALSTTNTSIRQNSSTLLTSTSNGAVIKSPPTPQYQKAVAANTVNKHSVASSSTIASSLSASSHVNSITQSVVSSSHPLHSVSNNIPQGGTSTNVPQTHIYQSQVAPSVQPKAFNLPPASILSSSQANSSLGQLKYSTQQKHVALSQTRTPLLPPNIHMGKSPVPAVQQKGPIINNVLVSNGNTSAHLKGTVPQTNVPQLKNSYVNKSVKNAPNNFIQPTGLCVASSVSPQNLSQTISPSLPNPVLPNLESISSDSTSLNSVILRSMPSPPPYSVAISRPWDTLVNSNSLMDLTPSLTDLKADDLDDLLPTLESELTHSPLPDLPEDFLNVHSNIISATEEITRPDDGKRKFLINPLTGELEPQPSDESDAEDVQDVFTGLHSPAALSDEDTCSTTRPDTTDQSDSETRSSDNSKQKLKNSGRDRGRDSPALKQEKIKLRLKLEKSEPINPAYKVDVSFINTQQPKKASTSMMSSSEELRVPPLHISLRGRNSVVIKNKSKSNSDGISVKQKIRKNPDHVKTKKSESFGAILVTEESAEKVNQPVMGDATVAEQIKLKVNNMEQKKIKKFKSLHEAKDGIAVISKESELKSKFVMHNHYKEKQKERRGSDSELVRNNKKFGDNCGILSDEKKRRLSQTDQPNTDQPPVLGSTNVGTITSLPQKPRKDKIKIKDVFKKDSGRNKSFCKSLGDKLQSKVVTLPTAGDMNMEAKFKQGLLEGTTDKGVPRPPHRTEVVNHLLAENNRLEAMLESSEKIIMTIPDTTSLKDKSPEPEKCNTPDMKSVELNEKQSAVTGSRSPNNGGGQGEDSGIESMDALSEKSPNQASQSPHADILPVPPKTQVPNMLDIEAQLAKMEGLNGDTDRGGGGDETTNIPTEDVNENKCHHDQTTKLKQCCELTCALQDSLKQGAMVLSATLTSTTLPSKQQVEVNLVPLKVKKEEDDLEPIPVRVTPALYTYSNAEKGRGGSESPTGLSDDDSNSCSTSSTLHSKPSKSLLEQLLIEIPNDHQSVPSSPSPATRSSMRTRALSKLGSPELNSPISKNTRNVPLTKRKRNESDSSNHSLEETKKKPKKAETPSDLVKNRVNDLNKVNIKKTGKVQQDESSDSDEPLIEKVRKPGTIAVNTQVNNVVMAAKTKVKSGPGTVANNNKAVVMHTRRSVRSNMPAQNTRSRGDKNPSESEALRRKTRSAVLDVDSKRKKEVK